MEFPAIAHLASFDYLPAMPPALYAAFDRYPSAKGAATHIHHMAETLFDAAGGGLLYVIGDPTLPAYQDEGSVEIFRFRDQIPHYLDRAFAFADGLRSLVESHPDLRIAHFQDPWSGMAILDGVGPETATVYEINGLPSIELPNLYPGLGRRTLDKFREIEQRCWTEADRLISPSETMKANLVELGVPAEKITVIPNGASLHAPMDPPPEAPERYLLYFGALQRWQGIEDLLRAFALLADFEDLQLVVCASTKPKHAREYARLSRRLGVAERMQWHFRLPKKELAGWIQGALATVAPLTECARNLEQGCCPLKILESMACGIPVVASDLPSVREIVTDGEEGLLCRAERPSEFARRLRLLIDHPEQRLEMGRRARDRIGQHFTWERSLEKLRAFYRDILNAERVS